MDLSWFEDAKGTSWLIQGGGEPLWLPVVSQASHALIAAAYLVVIVNLLRLYTRCKADLLVPETYLYLSILLIFGALMHIDEVAAYYWPNRVLFAGLKAATALVAVWRLPNFVGAARYELEKAHEAQELTAALRGEARPQGSVRHELDERYELLRARVLFLEDLFQRNTWIHQSTLAMQHLNELLSEFETVLDARPSRATMPANAACEPGPTVLEQV
jgi:hypothetical protein